VEVTGKPFPTHSWTIEDGCLKSLVVEWTNKEGRQARARGLEYQLVDRNSPDAMDPTRYTGALYSVLAAHEPDWTIGSFNQSRIVVNGDRVEHWLNGVNGDLDKPAESLFRDLVPEHPYSPPPLT
jgi:hypothetical protein